jgi:hypothetical protein
MIKQQVDDEIHSAKGEPYMKDTVNHPDHYGGADDPYEAIKVIEAWNLDFYLGNVIKYLSRVGKKGDELEDLKKARWYLDRKIARMEAVKVDGV